MDLSKALRAVGLVCGDRAGERNAQAIRVRLVSWVRMVIPAPWMAS